MLNWCKNLSGPFETYVCDIYVKFNIALSTTVYNLSEYFREWLYSFDEYTKLTRRFVPQNIIPLYRANRYFLAFDMHRAQVA